MKIMPTLQQKNFAKRYTICLALLICVPFLAVIFFVSVWSKPTQVIISDNASSQCGFDKDVQLALKHGLTVETTDRFGWYHVTGTRQALNQFQQERSQQPQDDATQPCKVHNLRQVVSHVKPALLPFIPNNADFVSYHPTQNKAVYCHYQFVDKGSLIGEKPNATVGSHCEFITVENHQLVSYDISDMERHNLDWWRDNRYFPLDIYQANSYVAKWEDKPTTYFGFQLLTAVNYSNFGFGQDY